MFLTKTDLSSAIYPEVRDMLTRYSDALILVHCSNAVAEMESYLAQRYNIRPELEKTGDLRNQLLVQIARDIAIWNLYQHAETIPNKVVKRYEEAKDYLRDLAKGDIILPGVGSAPKPPVGTPAGDQIGYGGKLPRAPLVD